MYVEKKMVGKSVIYTARCTNKYEHLPSKSMCMKRFDIEEWVSSENEIAAVVWIKFDDIDRKCWLFMSQFQFSWYDRIIHAFKFGQQSQTEIFSSSQMEKECVYNE